MKKSCPFLLGLEGLQAYLIYYYFLFPIPFLPHLCTTKLSCRSWAPVGREGAMGLCMLGSSQDRALPGPLWRPHLKFRVQLSSPVPPMPSVPPCVSSVRFACQTPLGRVGGADVEGAGSLPGAYCGCIIWNNTSKVVILMHVWMSVHACMYVSVCACIEPITRSLTHCQLKLEAVFCLWTTSWSLVFNTTHYHPASEYTPDFYLSGCELES